MRVAFPPDPACRSRINAFERPVQAPVREMSPTPIQVIVRPRLRRHILWRNMLPEGLKYSSLPQNYGQSW